MRASNLVSAFSDGRNAKKVKNTTFCTWKAIRLNFSKDPHGTGNFPAVDSTVNSGKILFTFKTSKHYFEGLKKSLSGVQLVRPIINC